MVNGSESYFELLCKSPAIGQTWKVYCDLDRNCVSERPDYSTGGHRQVPGQFEAHRDIFRLLFVSGIDSSLTELIREEERMVHDHYRSRKR